MLRSRPARRAVGTRFHAGLEPDPDPLCIRLPDRHFFLPEADRALEVEAGAGRVSDRLPDVVDENNLLEAVCPPADVELWAGLFTKRMGLPTSLGGVIGTGRLLPGARWLPPPTVLGGIKLLLLPFQGEATEGLEDQRRNGAIAQPATRAVLKDRRPRRVEPARTAFANEHLSPPIAIPGAESALGSGNKKLS